MTSEAILACGVHGAEALLLAQEEPIRADLGTDQLCYDLVLQRPKALLVFGGQLHEDGTVRQRLSAAVYRRDQRRHILQVGFRSNGRFQVIGAGPIHAVFVARVVEDPVFLRRRHLPNVDG